MTRWCEAMGALLMAAALVGCVMVREPSAEEMLTGTWKPRDSVAVYEIEFVEGEVRVSGHSEFSGKRLRILESSWDGEVLRFTSYLASTNMKVVHENRLTGPESMLSVIVETKSGAPRRHTVEWKKTAP